MERVSIAPDAVPVTGSAASTTAAPVRTCIGCRTRDAQSALLRLVAVREPGAPRAEVVADGARRLPGRGAWVHPSERCWNLALKKNAFSRALRSPGVGVPEMPSVIRSSAESG
ncbi:YlxR family protein [Brevibacterium samyangense]|uniref:YlxR family protein n=1 Tax=Brevibacterium samyangense TaxID=366888 RepID=UPI0031E069FC